MYLLVTGLAIWIVVHLIPSVAPGFRSTLVVKFGGGPYRGIFALAIFVSLALIVIGWRSTPEEYLYVLPPWSQPLSFMFMVVAFVLLGAAHYKTGIKRYVRHPMLTGVFIWSLGHLLVNGTTRALLLFGGLGLWALIEIPLISARNGSTQERPTSPGMGVELKGLAISAVIFAVMLILHPYFAGVSPFPG